MSKAAKAAKAVDIRFLQLVKKVDDNPLGKIKDIQNFVSKNTVSQFALNEALIIANTPNIVLMLLKLGANPNAISNNGTVPLVRAFGNLKKVELLIQYGANVNHVDTMGKSVLDYTVQYNTPIQKIITLLEHGAIPTPFFTRGIKNFSYYKPVLNYLAQKEAQKEAQRQMRQRLQIEQTKSRKQGVLEQLRIIPRIQTLSGGRYLYPGGRTYLQAGKEFQEIGRSRGMNVQFKQDIEYPQGYQQFWREYQGQLGGGPSGDSSYNLKSPRKTKKSIRKSRKLRKY